MMYYVSSSVELRIGSDGSNSEMCYELIYIDGMDKCYYATTFNNIMNILHQEPRYGMVYYLLYEDVLECDIL